MEQRETNTHCLTLWLRQRPGKGFLSREDQEGTVAGSMPAGWTQMGALTTRNWAAEKGQRGPPKGRLVPESGHVLGGLRVSGIGRRGGREGGG